MDLFHQVPSARIEEAESDDCRHCKGTGIGWAGPDSACSICHGTGRNTARPRWMEDDSSDFFDFDDEETAYD